MTRRLRALTTPDGRYIIVRDRLWRSSNPDLDPAHRQALVEQLMDARRAVKAASKAGDLEAIRAARAAVQQIKEALGERGQVWWRDGAPDMTRRMVANTPYAEWWTGLECGSPITSASITTASEQKRT